LHASDAVAAALGQSLLPGSTPFGERDGKEFPALAPQASANTGIAQSLVATHAGTADADADISDVVDNNGDDDSTTSVGVWRRVARPLREARRRAIERRAHTPFGEQRALVRDAGAMGSAAAEEAGYIHPAALGAFPELRPPRAILPPLPHVSTHRGQHTAQHALAPLWARPTHALAPAVASTLQLAGVSSASRQSVRFLCVSCLFVCLFVCLSGCLALSLTLSSVVYCGFVCFVCFVCIVFFLLLLNYSLLCVQVDVLRDVLADFLTSLGRTLRARSDQATGDDQVRAAANEPLQPLHLMSLTLGGMVYLCYYLFFVSFCNSCIFFIRRFGRKCVARCIASILAT